MKILLRRTRLNGDTIGFHSQSQKLTEIQSNPFFGFNTDRGIESLRINEVSVLNSLKRKYKGFLSPGKK